MPQGDLTLDELCDTLVIHLTEEKSLNWNRLVCLKLLIYQERSKQSFLAAWLASVVAVEIFSLP